MDIKNVTEIVLDEHIETLPHLYRGDNIKNIFEEPINQINSLIANMEDFRKSPFDPNENSGGMLDQCGSNWKIVRDTGMNDEDYRLKINEYILSLRSSGNIKEVLDYMYSYLFPNDQENLIIEEVNDLSKIPGMTGYGAYYLIHLRNEVVNKQQQVLELMTTLKSAGVGIIIKLLAQSVLGDDGKLYEIWKRSDYPNTWRDSHIIKESNLQSAEDVILPSYDISTESFKVRISTRLRIYLNNALVVGNNDGAPKGNVFNIDNRYRYLAFARDRVRIVWHLEDLYSPSVKSPNGQLWSLKTNGVTISTLKTYDRMLTTPIVRGTNNSLYEIKSSDSGVISFTLAQPAETIEKNDIIYKDETTKYKITINTTTSQIVLTEV